MIDRVRIRVLLALIAVILLGNVYGLTAVGDDDGGHDHSAHTHAATAADTHDDAAAVGEQGASPAAADAGQPPAAANDGSTAQPGNPSATTAPAPAASGGKPAEPVRSKGYEFEMLINPSCARRLQPMTATLRLVPGAYVSLVVAYADGKNHGEMYSGPVGADGTFTFPWTVPAQAALGEGNVLAAAHEPEGGKSGAKSVPFRVVEGSC